MSETLTITEAESQAAILRLVDRLGDGGLERIEMTRAGRIVAVLTAPAEAAPATALADIHGFLQGSVLLPSGFDLTAPVLDTFLAEDQDDFEG